MRRHKNSFYLFVLIIIFTVSVGYSILNSSVSINGYSEVFKNTWNIYFDNIQIVEGSVNAISDPVIASNKDMVSFEVFLDLPGDFFEFTVDVKNDGSIDAVIDSIVKTLDLDDEQKKYVNYVIEYENGEKINSNQLLTSGTLVTLKVRVEYRTDITEFDLPVTDQRINLSFIVNYVQAFYNLNARLNVISRTWESAPGVSLYDAINLKYEEEKALDEDTKFPKPTDYIVESSNTAHVFIDDNGNVINMNDIELIGGRTYQSTFCIKGKEVNNTNFTNGDYITTFINITTFIEEGRVSLINDRIIPIFLVLPTTYYNIVDLLYPDGNSFIIYAFSDDLKRETLGEYVVGFPSTQNAGCRNETVHRFFAFTDKYNNLIKLTDEVKDMDERVVISFVVDETEMTWEEAKIYAEEKINSMLN